MKRFIGLFLALVVCTGVLLPATAVRAATSGECGPNATWKFEDGTLTISGTGAVTFKEIPWYDHLTSIQRIVVEDGITSLGRYALTSCATSISIPDSIRYMHQEACFNLYNGMASDFSQLEFEPGDPYSHYEDGKYLGNANNPYLVLVSIEGESTEIKVHPDTKMILDWGYHKDVVISEGVTAIGEWTLYYAPSSIQVNEKNPSFTTDDYGVLFNKDKTELIKAPVDLSGSYTIPKGVKKIGSCAFYGCDLKEVTIPNSVEYIGTSAFAGCRIEEIVIPDSVKRIASCAFVDYRYSNSNRLTDITIGDGVTSIGFAAFFGAQNLENVTLGNNVKYIGSAAFTGNPFHGINEDILNIYEGGGYLGNERNPYVALMKPVSENFGPESIHKNTKYISPGIFDDEYTVYGNAEYAGTAENPYEVLVRAVSEDITECEIHPDTKVIDRCAFMNCKNLTEIEIPDGVIGIGTDAFSCCLNLRSVILPRSLEFIEALAFSGTYSLWEVTYKGSPKEWENVYIEYLNDGLHVAGVTCTGQDKAEEEGASATDFGMWIWIAGGAVVGAAAVTVPIVVVKKKKK